MNGKKKDTGGLHSLDSYPLDFNFILVIITMLDGTGIFFMSCVIFLHSKLSTVSPQT